MNSQCYIHIFKILLPLLFFILAPILEGTPPSIHPADKNFSGSIERSEVDAFETQWRSGTAGLLDLLTNASYIQQLGPCYVYNPATQKFIIRRCEPIVASPVVHFYRESPILSVKVHAPIVQFAREKSIQKINAPIVHFARENPKPTTVAPIQHFARPK